MDSNAARLIPSSRALRWALLGLGGLALLPLGWQLFGPRGVEVEVVGKTWQLELEVEKLVFESGSAWCDELPVGATILGRRAMPEASDGRAAGAEHCRYGAPQWRRRWGIRNEGPATLPPRWPEPKLSLAGPDGLGAERLGKRQARYLLQLRSSGGHSWSCELSPAQWQRVDASKHIRLRVDRQGTANCASLPVF